MLDSVVDEFHEVLVVLGIYFYEHGVGSGCEVTLYNLRNLVELLNHLAVREPFSRRTPM